MKFTVYKKSTVSCLNNYQLIALTGTTMNLYRQESRSRQLVECCQYNILSLNGDKTKKMIVDFRLSRWSATRGVGSTHGRQPPLLTQHLHHHQKHQQHLYFLWRLKKASVAISILTTFYQETTESNLSLPYCLVWQPLQI